MLIPFKELFQRHRVTVRGILHLGANTGQEAEAYDELGIKKVIWVEAHEPLYNQLACHVAPYHHLAIRACVSEHDGDLVHFHVASNQGQSSSFLELGTHAKEHPSVVYVKDVPMVTQRVDTMLARHGIKIRREEGPWLVNADLQGAELLALRGMGPVLAEFDYAYIEVNSDYLYRGCPLVGEIDDYLAKFGLVGCETKMTGSHWGDKFYQRAGC